MITRSFNQGGTMLRFAKPDGNSFNLDYTGPICAFDSGNDRIALCPGDWKVEGQSDEARLFFRSVFPHTQILDTDEGFLIKGRGDPAQWDDWEIVINIDDAQKPLLQRALASAWCGISLAERLVVEYSNGEDDADIQT